jgi:hypothetical protein
MAKDRKEGKGKVTDIKRILNAARRMKIGEFSQQDAAAEAGTTTAKIGQARHILKHGVPRLIHLVETGAMKLCTGHNLSKYSKSIQRETLAEGKLTPKGKRRKRMVPRSFLDAMLFVKREVDELENNHWKGYRREDAVKEVRALVKYIRKGGNHAL